jgi:hypothetical protein
MKCELCDASIISSLCYIWKHNEKILKVCDKCKATQVNEVMKYLEKKEKSYKVVDYDPISKTFLLREGKKIS